MSNSFSIIKKGYSQQEVDACILELEEAIDTYKSKEQYISQALVESHITSKKIIEEAEISAFEIEKDALIQLEHLKHELDSTKRRLESFKNDYDIFIEHFKSSFTDNELQAVLETIDEIDNLISDPKKNKAV
ncbi:hypothetical protein AN1V17_31800 [Vallitalea sediminicola]